MAELTIRDFRWGWNEDAVDGALLMDPARKAAEFRIFENALANARGGISKRPGTNKVNAVSLGGQVEQLLEWIRADASVVNLAVVNRGGIHSLIRINLDGSTVDLIEVAGLIGAVAFQDRLWFVDGNEYRVYNGTSVSVAQLAAAGNAPTLTGSGSGTWDGTYYGRVVYIDAYGVESAPSPPSAGCVLSDKQQIDWTNIAIGPAGTVKRRLYRTTAGGDVYYHLADIDNNEATTYIDTIKDDVLVTRTTLPLDLDLTPVKRCTQILWHSKSLRFFWCGDGSSAIYYSEPNGPAQRRSISTLVPTTGQGAALAMTELVDTIIVHYARGMRYYAGIDPSTDAVWARMPTSHGVASPRAIDLATNSLSFIAKGGWFFISPALIGAPDTLKVNEDLARDISEDKISTVIQSITAPEKTATAFHEKTRRIYLACALSGNRNTDIIGTEEKYGSFFRWTLAANDILAKVDGELWFGIENYILKLDPLSLHDVVADGSLVPIAFRIVTDKIDAGTSTMKKEWQKLYIRFKNPHFGDYRLGVRVVIDHEIVVDEAYTPESNYDIITAEFDLHMTSGIWIQVFLSNDQMDTPTEIEEITILYEIVETFGRER